MIRHLATEMTTEGWGFSGEVLRGLGGRGMPTENHFSGFLPSKRENTKPAFPLESEAHERVIKTNHLSTQMAARDGGQVEPQEADAFFRKKTTSGTISGVLEPYENISLLFL